MPTNKELTLRIKALEREASALRKTNAVLTARVEKTIDESGNLHALFERYMTLKDEVSQYLRTEAELRKFKEILEGQVAERTRELLQANKRLEKSNEKLKLLAVTDGLTGLYNHSYMNEEIQQRIREANRYGKIFSLIMFDLDHFKQINDIHGHLAGDAVLQTVAATFKTHLREVDILGRYGGEEFILILPNTDLVGARDTAEKLRLAIRKLRWSGIERTLTVSAGVCSYQKALTAREIIACADECLYRAKELGRDKVVSA